MVDVRVRHVGRLPGDLTSFVGRRQATSRVRQLLSDARMVTLTGVAGVGKSRLAVHVARTIERSFQDGAWFVDLGSVTSSTPLAGVVLSALGVPARTPDPERDLLEYLANRRLLLVLDGCDRLVAECGRLAQRVLGGSPRVSILATSHAPLNIAGEHVWPVLPMSVPFADERDKGAQQLCEAMELFEDRASAVLPGFTIGPETERAVARLCRQLDGLPLAIELAAVWMRSLSVEEILARLTHRFRLLTTGDRSAAARHQTLQAAMDSSFELCSETERILWARLSVFAGGFGLEDAEAVCAGDGLSPANVFAAVSALVENSVLAREGWQQARVRYRLLETVREYGQDRLGGGRRERDLRRRHRDHYLCWAEHVDADWFGPRQREWLGRLRDDRENLRKALEFSLTEPGGQRFGVRLALALRYFWLVGDLSGDGRYWLAGALAVSPEPPLLRARTMMLYALVTALHEDCVAGLAWAEEAKRTASEPAGNSAFWCAGGLINLFADNLDAAAELLERATRGLRTLDALALLSRPALALVATVRGDVARGLELCGRCREICDEHGELWVKSWADTVEGLAYWTRGDLDEAASSLTRALRTKHHLDDTAGIAVCIEILSWVAAARADVVRAARLQRAHDLVQWPAKQQLFQNGRYGRWHAQCVARIRRGLRGAQLPAEHTPTTLAEVVDTAVGTHTTSTSDLPARLTRREWEVAELIARGLSNREIAERLGIAKRTSDSHVEHILSKRAFVSRTQVAVWVAEQEHRPGA